MKKFWAFFALFFVFATLSAPLQAKRLGGGKSFGRTYQTAPAPAAKPSPYNAAPAAAPNRAQSAPQRGLLGGVLGGLLAGGLIGALFGGGFHGIQFMDVLILGALAFFIARFLRARRPAWAPAAGPGPGSGSGSGSGSGPGPGHSGPPPRRTFELGQPDVQPVVTPAGAGFGAGSVPFRLPPSFDASAFLQGARDHYRKLQDAWNKNDLATLREYFSPELYRDLCAERASLPGEQHTEVLFVDAELVRADQAFGKAELSIKFSGRYRDSVEGVEEAITDIWHLERDLAQANAPWYIVGIEA